MLIDTAGEFYNLDTCEHGQLRRLASGVVARIFLGDKSMLSLVTVEPNAQGEIHKHPEEQWGLLVEGSGVRVQGGIEHPVQAGDFWRTPSNVSHGFRAGRDGAHILDIFSPPREGYKRCGTGFGQKKQGV